MPLPLETRVKFHIVPLLSHFDSLYSFDQLFTSQLSLPHDFITRFEHTHENFSFWVDRYQVVLITNGLVNGFYLCHISNFDGLEGQANERQNVGEKEQSRSTWLSRSNMDWTYLLAAMGSCFRARTCIWKTWQMSHLKFQAIFSNPKVIWNSGQMKLICFWIWILNPTSKQT